MPFEILTETNVSLKKLTPDPHNVNLHDERNLEAIQESLKRFGQPERLIVRKSDNLVFSGNGRLEAMQRLAIKSARVQYIEGTDDECRAYAVAANRTARLSRFDETELAELLSELKNNDPGIVAATGFNEEELERLLEDLKPDVQAPESDLDVSRAGTSVTCPQCHHTFLVGGAK